MVWEWMGQWRLESIYCHHQPNINRFLGMDDLKRFAHVEVLVFSNCLHYLQHQSPARIAATLVKVSIISSTLFISPIRMSLQKSESLVESSITHNFIPRL
jgi:hypothetical protein